MHQTLVSRWVGLLRKWRGFFQEEVKNGLWDDHIPGNIISMVDMMDETGVFLGKFEADVAVMVILLRHFCFSLDTLCRK